MDTTLTEQLLTPKDVAHVLKVSARQVYNMVKGGDIPAVKFGKTVRVREADLVEFITKHRIENG